jgi:C4-dicarboxylate transporter, DctQ subunit
MTFIARVNAGLWGLARISIAMLLLAATALVFANVVFRYFFNYALSWGDELVTYSLLWLVFLGSGIAARQGAHISMEVLLTLLPERTRRYNAVFVHAVCGGLSAVVGFLGWRLAMNVRAVEQVGAASGIPMFLVYLAIPAGCLLMVLGFWEVAFRHLTNSAPPPQPGDSAPKNLSVSG